MTTFFVSALAVIAMLGFKIYNNSNDIAQQIIKEHEEEIKRLKYRYE
jgi:hypothetical protein